MKWFLVLLFMVAAISGIGRNSPAEETGQILNNNKSAEVGIKDEAKFLTVKDEKGDQHLFKTIALIRFSEDQIEFEPGEAISAETTTEATIPQSQTPFEQ